MRVSDFYKVIPVKDNVYRITSLEGVFCELLVGYEKAMLIDTGHGFGNLKETVRKITDKPLIIVNTHGHLDHVCGNAQFDEPVYIGSEDMELCRIHTSKEYRMAVAKNAENVMDWQTGKTVYGLPEDFELEKYLSYGSGSLVPCEEGQVFDLGGMTIRVYATPGHTKGGRSFYYEELKWLYTGDAVCPIVWLFMPESTDRKTHIATLDKVLSLPVERVYSGHNPMPATLEDVMLYKKVALEADYEKGIPFKNPIIKETDVRICIIEGKTMEDIMKPGFASIVISRDR